MKTKQNYHKTLELSKHIIKDTASRLQYLRSLKDPRYERAVDDIIFRLKRLYDLLDEEFNIFWNEN